MRTTLTSLAFLVLAGLGFAFQQAQAKGHLPDETLIAVQLPSYPLTTCPVSGEELGGMGAPVNLVHDGRLVRFCCKNCVGEFKKDPAKVLAKVDAAVIKAQKATYPMTTCPVSGKALGADAVDVVHGTRLVRFCCTKCPTAFAKEPGKFMAQVDQALIDAQKKSYKPTTCPVSGKPLGDAPVDRLYGTQLVRFCCEKCPTAFFAEPQKYEAKISGLKKLSEAAAPGKKQ
jgi:YHS domain-containing protein